MRVTMESKNFDKQSKIEQNYIPSSTVKVAVLTVLADRCPDAMHFIVVLSF